MLTGRGFDLLGGAAIKSIQFISDMGGSSTGVNTTSRTITSVDTSKTVLIPMFYPGTTQYDFKGAYVHLSATNQLTMKYNCAEACVYIVEFSSGITVQRGVGQMTSSSTTITINSVNTSKSFVFVCGIQLDTGDVFYASRAMTYGYLSNSTTLTVTRAEGVGTCEFAWQVITFL